MDFLASENHFFFFFIFQTLLAVKAFFSLVYKFIFITNTLFWLVETILFQFLKYPFYWKQFFPSHGNIFESFITASGTNFLFNGNDILWFMFFLETIIAIRGRPLF